MKEAEKEYRKNKNIKEKQTNEKTVKTKKIEDIEPFWMDKKIEKQEISKEEQEEFDNLIKNF